MVYTKRWAVAMVYTKRRVAAVVYTKRWAAAMVSTKRWASAMASTKRWAAAMVFLPKDGENVSLGDLIYCQAIADCFRNLLILICIYN